MSAVAPILIFLFMAILDLQIGLIFLGFALITVLLPVIFHRWSGRSSAEMRRSYGALGADFLDSVQGLATLKAYGQSKIRGSMLAQRANHLYRSTMGLVAANGATSAVSILGMTAGAAVALGVGAVRVSNGDLELRPLLIVLMLGVEVFRPLRELTQLYHQGMVAIAAAQSVFNLLDLPVVIQEPERPSVGPLDSAGQWRLKPEIRFENVTFAYKSGHPPP